MIDVHDGRELQRVTGFFSPHGFSVLPDGSKVYVSSLGAHEVAILDGTSGRMLKRLAIVMWPRRRAQSTAVFVGD